MLALANETMELVLDPDRGARVVSLVDRRSGRDWLVPGPATGETAEDAPYLGAEARGWDECFPTVAPCAGDDHGWPGRLRDHGAMWGRPWACRREDGALAARYEDARFVFERVLTLRDATVTARYRLENTGQTRFGYLYSQHLLLALRPGETLAATGLGTVHPSGAMDGPGVPLEDLAEYNPVRGVEAGVAGKFYALLTGPARITAGGGGGAGGAVTLAWTPQDAAAAGFWFAYGGWADGAGLHQVAIEPTTAPVDALAEGGALWLEPGEGRDWTVTITLDAAQEAAT